MTAGSYRFFLGGHDLEMATIAALLREEGVGFEDGRLAWGARASDYASGIAAALDKGETPVLVELAPDLAPDLAARCVWLDHHGERAGADKPSSLRQAFDLLELPEVAWCRRFALVAANDIGHIGGLLAAGATSKEIADIRAADRRAQGVTPEEEDEARQALAQAEQKPGYLLVRLPHERSSILSDFAHPALAEVVGATAGRSLAETAPHPGHPLGGRGSLEGSADMLVLGPDTLSWYGRGEAVRALAENFGGWWGGALPERGYWGQNRAEAPLESVEALLVGLL